VGPSGDQTWQVTGDGAGTVAGASFEGFENLTGAADNQDTFDVSAAGRVAGTIDGGAGGYDTLKLDAAGGSVSAVGFDPHSGVIAIDGVRYVYAGLEPISIAAPTNLTVNGTAGDDVATLTAHATQLGWFTFSGATFETVDFERPSVSLLIDALGGQDSVTVANTFGVLDFGAIPVTITAETIVVDGSLITTDDVTLDARASAQTGATTNRSASAQVNGSISGRHVVVSATTEQAVSLLAQIASGPVTITLTSNALAEITGTIVAETLQVIAQTLVDVVYAGTAPTTTPWLGVGLPSVDAVVSVAATNSTTARILDGASLTVGGTSISGTEPATVVVSALDDTSVSITIVDGSAATRLGTLVPGPNPGAQFSFDNLQALVTLSRDTRATLAADVTSTGVVAVRARNQGTIESTVTSDLVGIARHTVTTDNAVASVTGAALTVGGLEVSATSAGSYDASAKDARNDVTGQTLASVTDSVIAAGADGVQITAEDLSTLRAHAGDQILVPGTPLVTATAALAWNLLNRTVRAAVENSSIDALGDVAVRALADATLVSDTTAASIAQNPSAAITSDVLAVAALFAANVLRGDVAAVVLNSTVAGANLLIAALAQQALIDATSQVSAVAATGTSAVELLPKLTLGVALAVNFIGWLVAQTALAAFLAAIDALLGTDFGTEETWDVTASAIDSDLTADADLTLTARSAEVINATVSNTAASTAAGLFGTASAGAGAVVASNKISSSARALVDSTTSQRVNLTAGGALRVVADDAAGIYSNVKLTVSSITTNDGGVHALGAALDLLVDPTYQSSQGLQSLVFGNTVLLADGSVYQWMGPNTPTLVDLLTADYEDLGYWKPVGSTDYFPQGFNVTTSPSVAVAAVVVLNDVRSDVAASVTDAEIEVHDLLVQAREEAFIRADVDVTATASGGSSFSGGLALAANGIIATNRVLGGASATVAASVVNATGDIVVDASNVAEILASVRAAMAGSATAIGVILAFNTIGWQPTNVFFATVDALIGDPLIQNEAFNGETPVEANATLANTPVTAGGAVHVTAVTAATIRASVGNDATSAPATLFGFG
ncbi:MAG: hypothetical protein WBP09_11645, partial [Propionicimonas sp.]